MERRRPGPFVTRTPSFNVDGFPEGLLTSPRRSGAREIDLRAVCDLVDVELVEVPHRSAALR